MDRMRIVSSLVVVLALGCAGSAPTTTPTVTGGAAATAGEPEPPSRTLGDEIGGDETAWLEGDVADAPEVLARYPDDPRALYRMGRYELGQGELDAAEERFRTVLSRVDDDEELAWRARARLALVLARDGRPIVAREMGGLMCANPDPAMVPAFMAPLIAELEAEGACGGGCAQAVACCRAYVEAMRGAGDTGLDADQVCRGLEQLTTMDGAEEACRSATDGFRQALEAVMQDVPDACRR